MLKKAEQSQLKEALLSEKERLLKNAKEGLQFSMDRGKLNIGRDSMDESMEEQILSTELRLRDREKYLLNKVDEAIERLEKGTIEECEECGEKISFRRLLARPTTTLCIDCKESKEKDEQAKLLLKEGGLGMESSFSDSDSEDESS